MKKILFIGNSHTYMNDMPELAREMMESATGEPCEVFMLAYSGRPLKWHMEEEYFAVRFNILHGGYDYCVIQEQAHPMPPEEDTVRCAERIFGLCRKAGTVPVIVETWAEKIKPENQAPMNRRYSKIASEQNVLMAPVGEVWEMVLPVLKEKAGTDLFFRDGEHASAIGDYLAAMVIVKTITGRLPAPEFRKTFDIYPSGRRVAACQGECRRGDRGTARRGRKHRARAGTLAWKYELWTRSIKPCSSRCTGRRR